MLHLSFQPHAFVYSLPVTDLNEANDALHRPVKKKGGTSAGLPKESNPRSPGNAAVGNTVRLLIHVIAKLYVAIVILFGLLAQAKLWVGCFLENHECD